ncbi:hypothetical protein DFH27DRAFT_34355 [Peziza echinospora]|nr:hypothetical protein DFH27DRAFT_34355 [Peziza echinospora]
MKSIDAILKDIKSSVTSKEEVKLTAGKGQRFSLSSEALRIVDSLKWGIMVVWAVKNIIGPALVALYREGHLPARERGWAKEDVAAAKKVTVTSSLLCFLSCLILIFFCLITIGVFKVKKIRSSKSKALSRIKHLVQKKKKNKNRIF